VVRVSSGEEGGGGTVRRAEKEKDAIVVIWLEIGFKTKLGAEKGTRDQTERKGIMKVGPNPNRKRKFLTIEHP